MYRSAYRVLMVLPLMFCSVGIYLGVRAWLSPKTADHPITISTSTTWLTDHVDENGFVDYEKAINVRQSQGTSPDRNAALGLVKAFGINSLSQKNRTQYLQDMQVDLSEFVGNEELPSTGKRNFENLQGPTAAELLNKVYDKPWSLNEQDTVRINDWLANNDLPVKAALEAIDLPDFYFPFHRDSVNDWIVLYRQPFLNKCRELTMFLNIRAMRALGENDVKSAIRDTLAIRKLARRLSDGATPFELFVGYEIEIRAVAIEKQLLHNGALTAEQAMDYRDQLQSLPPRGDMAEKVESGLRMLMLDSVNRLAKQKFAQTDSQQNQHPRRHDGYFLFQKFNVDLDQTMRQVNIKLDQVVAAIKQPCLQDQFTALRQIGLNTPQSGGVALFSSLLMRSPSARGQLLADMSTANMLFIPESLLLKECELIAYDRLIPLAFTLQARNKNGQEFPASVTELTPEIVAEIPRSPFDLSPLEYTKTESGFILQFQQPIAMNLSNAVDFPSVAVGLER